MSELHILTMEDMLPRMEQHHQFEGRPGAELGFWCLNQHYTHKLGGVTDWTGLPGSGKTYFVLEVLFQLAERYGQRSFLYVPDLGSEEEIIEKLVKMRLGKDMSSKYGNKMEQHEIHGAMAWVMHHFVISVRRKMGNGRRSSKPTPMAVWEMACNYHDDNGPINNILIDSWKNMKHVFTGREDTYLDEVLSDRNEMAEDYGKHIHTIAHATKPKQFGKIRAIPTAYDIKGGGAWNDNGRSIITVDFPDKSKTNVDLYISKTKPENVGKPGAIIDRLFLDPRRGRYYEKMGSSIMFAYDYKSATVSVQQQMDLPNPHLNTEPSPI